MTQERDRPVFSQPPDRNNKFVQELARLIYETVFLPGHVIDDDIMPTFERAREESIGGYERAVEAAVLVVCRIQWREPT